MKLEEDIFKNNSEIVIYTKTEEETKKVGKELKITEGFLREYGMEDQISSPTFTIVNEYIKNGKKIYHFDVYRLSDIEEFYDMGGDEYYDRATCIIEWADIIEDALPDRYLKIIIEKEEDIEVRKITIKYIKK